MEGLALIATFAISATSPFGKTTLPRFRQVGEGASPSLDADENINDEGK
jgi:hypothetical protein